MFYFYVLIPIDLFKSFVCLQVTTAIEAVALYEAM